MQIMYSDEGILCEFILMTIGESRGSSATPAPNPSRAASKRLGSRQSLEAAPSSRRPPSSNMPPPPKSAAAGVSRESAKARTSRPTPPPPQSVVPSQALFFPEPDEDRRWDPVSYDEEDDEMLLWDAGGDDVGRSNNLILQVLIISIGTNDNEFCSTFAARSDSESSC